MRISDWSSDVCSSDLFPVDLEVEALSFDGERDQAWLQQWRDADADVSRRLDAMVAGEPELTPHEVAAAVSRGVPAWGLLVVGASSPIRDLDLMSRPGPVGQHRKVIANRGLAGIDGTISTAIGAALARPQGSRARKSVGAGKGGAVRVDHGGSRIIKK